MQVFIKKLLRLGLLFSSLFHIGAFGAQYFNYPYATNAPISIDPTLMAQTLISEARKENPNTELSLKFDPKQYPGLFAYLSGSSSMRVSGMPLKQWYYLKYHSQELIAWILSKPDNSLLPHQLFAKAIELSDGDVLKATVMIHESLRNYARGLADYTFPEIALSERDRVYNKFMDIRGDLAELNPKKFKGDHYGSWYRVWTLMASQMSSEYQNPAARYYRLGRNLTYSFMGEVMKLLMGSKFVFSDKRKIYINSVGARVGFALEKRLLEEKAGIVGPNIEPEDLEQELTYLQKGESKPNCLKSFFSFFLK